LRFENGPIPRMGEKFIKQMKDDHEIKILKKEIALGYKSKGKIWDCFRRRNCVFNIVCQDLRKLFKVY